MNAAFYVTVIDDDGHPHRMRGPFWDHKSALNAVIFTSRAAEAIDPRCAFWFWGTCKLEMPGWDFPLGKLDKLDKRWIAECQRELAAEIGCRVDQLNEWRISECENCGLSIKIHRDSDPSGLCRDCGDAIRGAA